MSVFLSPLLWYIAEVLQTAVEAVRDAGCRVSS